MERYSEASIHTAFGSFSITIYRHAGQGPADPLRIEEHVAVHTGDLSGAEDVFTRVHSECFTGEVMGSLGCDCREQLDRALAEIAARGVGVVVYLRQEGRGIGLGNKVLAYHLQQEKGHDTVDANEALGFAPDPRTFEIAAAILGDLGVRSIHLNTNNTQKIRDLSAAGIPVTARVPSAATVHHHNRAYMSAKRERLGHLLPKQQVPEEV
jgi:GTP cyclohydrolase II